MATTPARRSPTWLRHRSLRTRASDATRAAMSWFPGSVRPELSWCCGVRRGRTSCTADTPSAVELPSRYPLDGFESAIARAERALTIVIVAAATIVQANAILHHGF